MVSCRCAFNGEMIPGYVSCRNVFSSSVSPSISATIRCNELHRGSDVFEEMFMAFHQAEEIRKHLMLASDVAWRRAAT